MVLLVVPLPLPTPWTVGRRSPALLEGAAAVVSHYRDMQPPEAAPVADADAFNLKTSGCGACAVLMRQGWKGVRGGRGADRDAAPGVVAGRRGLRQSVATPDAPAAAGAPPRGLRRSRPPLIRHLARHRRRARAVGSAGDGRCRHQGEDGGRPRVPDACAWGEGGKVKSLNSGECLLRVVQAGERNTSRQTELPTGQSRLGDRLPSLRESPASLPVQRRPHHSYALDGRAGACSC